MSGNFWKSENMGTAVIILVVLYFLGIYIFMLPAYLRRLQHPHAANSNLPGLSRNRDLYTPVFILSPFIFLLVVGEGLAGIIVSAAAFFLLMLIYPFYWFYSRLPGGIRLGFVAGWNAFAGLIFDTCRKVLETLTGNPLKDNEPGYGMDEPPLET